MSEPESQPIQTVEAEGAWPFSEASFARGLHGLMASGADRG